MNKDDILKEVIKCARKYKENLENKNILFIYYEKSNICYIEAKFTPNNFLHLTGLEYTKSINQKEFHNSKKFYKDLINQKVSPRNIIIKNKNTIKLKLQILYNLMNINYIARMIGNYNNGSKNLLYTEKVIGNITYCMGFKRVNKCYIPNTALKEDTRKISENTNKIIAIFTKNITDYKYKNLTYISKDTELIKLFENDNLKQIIDIQEVYSNNNSYNQKILKYISNYKK